MKIEEILIKNLASFLNNDNVTPEKHYRKWKEIYPDTDKQVKEAMREFGKYIIEESVEEMRKMQSAKYNAGETGYIDNEWRHILKEELKKKLL